MNPSLDFSLGVLQNGIETELKKAQKYKNGRMKLSSN
jgi:hypothetical protein